MKPAGMWVSWSLLALAASVYLGSVLTTTDSLARTIFLPGATTYGHFQIELACASCHTPFKGVTSEACMACHARELAAVNDSHPRAKFTDPRNAELLNRLDATSCVTCHVEHKPAVTRAVGVTQPEDYCHACHAGIASERPSHAGMTFQSCAAAGCHNYHDNTALYEDFLLAHAGTPELLPDPRVAARAMPSAAASATRRASLPSDAPPDLGLDPGRLAALESTTHARAGVNCTGCHTAAGADDHRWLATPRQPECATCHHEESEGFLGGRHGMRLASGLPPMTPGLARLPMNAAAHDRELTCSSCHSAHAFDTRAAAADACLGCHDDTHSRAYVGSPHHVLWVREVQGSAPAGTGVSCATCHLPRLRRREGGADTVFVQHNQSANLRPNEKMTRTVCLDCHGLGFSIDALADARLVAANFAGRPRASVASLEMALTRTNRTPH